MRGWIRAAVLLLVLISLGGSAVHAQTGDGGDVCCTLTIQFRYDQEGICGARFRLYRVADVNRNREYTMVEPFEDVQGNAADLEEMTLGLSQRVTQSHADYEMVTDEEGTAGLSRLAPGIWLMVGEPTQVGEVTHYVDPQLIVLPQKNEAGEDCYDIQLRPKSVPLPSSMEPVERTVVKIWDDGGYASQRPGSITVRLMKDGQVVDRVELSRDNNWQHTWTNLIPTANWYVEEAVPQGYTMELQQAEGVFTMTNHRKDIPQTGHIWWPVALVMVSGFVLVVLGIILRRSDRHEA